MSPRLFCMGDLAKWRVTCTGRRSKTPTTKGVPMFLSLLLSYLNRSPRFAWKPALNLQDRSIYSTLLPGAQY